MTRNMRQRRLSCTNCTKSGLSTGTRFQICRIRPTLILIFVGNLRFSWLKLKVLTEGLGGFGN
jgi:hypothetical protein